MCEAAACFICSGQNRGKLMSGHGWQIHRRQESSEEPTGGVQAALGAEPVVHKQPCPRRIHMVQHAAGQRAGRALGSLRKVRLHVMARLQLPAAACSCAWHVHVCRNSHVPVVVVLHSLATLKRHRTCKEDTCRLLIYQPHMLTPAALHRRGTTPLGSPRASGLGERRLSGYSRHSGYSRLSGQGPGSSVRSASMAPIAGGLDDVPLSLAGTWWTRWGCAIFGCRTTFAGMQTGMSALAAATVAQLYTGGFAVAIAQLAMLYTASNFREHTPEATADVNAPLLICGTIVSSLAQRC